MLGYFGTIQGRFRAGNTNSKKTFSVEVKLKDSEGASVFNCVYHTTDTTVSTKIPLVRQSSDLILPEKKQKYSFWVIYHGSGPYDYCDSIRQGGSPLSIWVVRVSLTLYWTNQVALCDLLSIISKGNGSEPCGSVSAAALLLGLLCFSLQLCMCCLQILPSIAETLSQQVRLW